MQIILHDSSNNFFADLEHLAIDLGIGGVDSDDHDHYAKPGEEVYDGPVEFHDDDHDHDEHDHKELHDVTVNVRYIHNPAKIVKTIFIPFLY